MNVGVQALNQSLILIQNLTATLVQTVRDAINASILITKAVVQGIYDAVVGIFDTVETIVKGIVDLIGKLIITIITLPFTIIKGLFSAIFGSGNDTREMTVPTSPHDSGLTVNIFYAVNDTLAATFVSDTSGTHSIELPVDTYYAECVLGTSDVVFLGFDTILPISGVETVGGIQISPDKVGLLAPYIGLASTMMIGAVATVVYVKRVKRRKEKQ